MLRPFEIIDGETNDHLHASTDLRLREGGKSDWPVLAAAMVLESGIWSEDVDLVGVGIPEWSNENVLLRDETQGLM